MLLTITGSRGVNRGVKTYDGGCVWSTTSEHSMCATRVCVSGIAISDHVLRLSSAIARNGYPLPGMALDANGIGIPSLLGVPGLYGNPEWSGVPIANGYPVCHGVPRCMEIRSSRACLDSQDIQLSAACLPLRDTQGRRGACLASEDTLYRSACLGAKDTPRPWRCPATRETQSSVACL